MANKKNDNKVITVATNNNGIIIADDKNNGGIMELTFENQKLIKSGADNGSVLVVFDKNYKFLQEENAKNNIVKLYWSESNQKFKVLVKTSTEKIKYSLYDCSYNEQIASANGIETVDKVIYQKCSTGKKAKKKPQVSLEQIDSCKTFESLSSMCGLDFVLDRTSCYASIEYDLKHIQDLEQKIIEAKQDAIKLFASITDTEETKVSFKDVKNKAPELIEKRLIEEKKAQTEKINKSLSKAKATKVADKVGKNLTDQDKLALVSELLKGLSPEMLATILNPDKQ